jgi:DNA-directed RNA polymerase specialized sigma24 family protein
MSDPEERFAALYADHYPPILRYAVRRIDGEHARDIAMETFLIAWRRLDDVPRAADEALLWLYRVARNTLANEQRGIRRVIATIPG